MFFGEGPNRQSAELSKQMWYQYETMRQDRGAVGEQPRDLNFKRWWGVRTICSLLIEALDQ